MVSDREASEDYGGRQERQGEPEYHGRKGIRVNVRLGRASGVEHAVDSGRDATISGYDAHSTPERREGTDVAMVLDGDDDEFARRGGRGRGYLVR